jgi:hypothetical protein
MRDLIQGNRNSDYNKTMSTAKQRACYALNRDKILAKRRARRQEIKQTNNLMQILALPGAMAAMAKEQKAKPARKRK